MGKLLAEYYGKEGHDDYDPLHKAGRVDVHMRADKIFVFLLDNTDAITAVYRFFNLGQEFHHFMSVADELREAGVDIVAKLPRFFSDTRFANYVHLVLKGFIENYPALIKSIMEVQEDGMKADATDNQKKKADQCAGLQVQIYSLQFGLTSCGLSDIYNHYSKTVNVLQIVNILPHEKYDIFEEDCRQKLKEMVTTVQPEDCGCLLQEAGVSMTEGAEDAGANKETEQLVECLFCNQDELLEDVVSCRAGHSYCRDCVRRAAAVAVKNSRTGVRCLRECDQELDWNQLNKAVDPSLFSKLLQRRQADEVIGAQHDCWKCKNKFSKEDGCNKMTCSCGARMCYLCKEKDVDPSHFYGQGGAPTETRKQERIFVLIFPPCCCKFLLGKNIAF